MITKEGLEAYNEALAAVPVKASVVIDGVTKYLPITSTSVEGSTFKVNVYLDDTLAGKITATKLYDVKNRCINNRADVIPKPSTKSLLIVFEMRLSEVSP